jgi:hypothetical protein
VVRTKTLTCVQRPPVCLPLPASHARRYTRQCYVVGQSASKNDGTWRAWLNPCPTHARGVRTLRHRYNGWIDEPLKAAEQLKELRFPPRLAVGDLFIRDQHTGSRRWQRIGEARGVKEVPEGELQLAFTSPRDLVTLVSKVPDETRAAITAISINDPPVFLEEALSSLEWFPYLRVLYLDGFAFSDRDLPWLRKLIGLEELALLGTQVTGLGLKHLQSLRRLRDLRACLAMV